MSEEKGIQLGGSIELSGFSEMKGGEMVIVKKIVGNHVKKITEISKEFKSIKLNLKTVHEIEDSKKFELHALLLADKQYNSEVTENNLFVAIDKVLKKIINLIS
jgi:ribosome-associated translation inhibitor RaiA